MTIRTRLLSLLLPPLIAFVTIISLFFYYNWQREIISSFKDRLVTTVVSVASTLPVEAIKQGNKSLLGDFTEILENVGLSSIYLVEIESVKKGEPVLNKEPFSPSNPIYDGKDPSLAFRQVYLMEVSQKKPRQPGDQDFSETGEQALYMTKRPLVSDEYIARESKEHIITAYAPVLDKDEKVKALLGADISMETIDQKLKNAAMIIALSALATIFLVVMAVYYGANRISRPIQNLKSAAISLAAGEYGTQVDTKGPQEISELANTLNTMSECLMENIDRLKQSAAVRERLYGEYECALLLQEKMFKKPLGEFSSPICQIQGIQTAAAQEPHGVYVSLYGSNESEVDFELMENEQSGFEGIYQLLHESATPQCHYPCVHLMLKKDELKYERNQFPAPILWQQGVMKFLEEKEGAELISSGDILLVANHSFWKILANHEKVSLFLQRILRNFAGDSFQIFTSMLQQELTFLSEQHHLDREIFIVAFKF